MSKPNALYLMSGGGTAVISASAYGLASQITNEYRDRVGTLYAAIGGVRGLANEDITDVFRWIESAPDPMYRMNRISFPATPIFGTSRLNPDGEDCVRILDVCKAHDVKYLFLNGGNDTQEKAIRISRIAKEQGYELHVIGVPKTVDNDLLITHRCPGYATFAKQVAIDTASLYDDIAAFSLHPDAVRGGPLKEGAVAQVVVYMGRDEGWGAAASVLAKYDEKAGPHVILTKEGGFDEVKFLDRCQNAFDRYGTLMVVASEGAFDAKAGEYLGNRLEAMAYRQGMMFKVHQDAHKNTSVTDSRLNLYLKLLLEKKLNIPTGVVYKDFKTRGEGPGYLNRDHLIVMSEVDFKDAEAVGRRAADLAIGEGKNEVMVTLTHVPGETSYTDLSNVADPEKGSKAFTKSIGVLDTAEKPILETDGMMVDRELFAAYIEKFADINGPNRDSVLGLRGFRIPLERIAWELEPRLLPAYEKAKK